MKVEFNNLLAELKKGVYHPVYMLCGEEPYFIDCISNYIEKNVLPDDEKDFNLSVIYGKDSNMSNVLDSALRLPMMSEHNVIVVKEAQNLSDFDKDAGNDALSKYINHPTESTILVFCIKKKLDSRKKIYKEIEKNCILFESSPLEDRHMAAWITNYLKDKDRIIEPQTAELLAAQLGNNLTIVTNELDKLLILSSAKTITSKEVEENVGISKEFNVFELQKAIGARDMFKSIQIAQHLGRNPKNSIIPNIALLFSFFYKVMLYHESPSKDDASLLAYIGANRFFLMDYKIAARNYSLAQCAQVMSILREFDAYSKGIDAPSIGDEELLREMTIKILLC